MANQKFPVLALEMYPSDQDRLKAIRLTLFDKKIQADNEERIQAVVTSNNDHCSRLVDLLMHPSPEIMHPVLEIVAHIVTGNDLQTQAMLGEGVLEPLSKILKGKYQDKVTSEALYAISNITAGTGDQRKAVVDSGIIDSVIRLLKEGEIAIRKQAATALSNATHGMSPQEITEFVSQGCIRPLLDLLECDDPVTVSDCLVGLRNILEAGEAGEAGQNAEKSVNQFVETIDEFEGLDKIQNAADHVLEMVSEKAKSIWERFWPEEPKRNLRQVNDIYQKRRNAYGRPGQRNQRGK